MCHQEPDDVVNLLTKVVDVQLPERKELVKDSKVATDVASDGLEDSCHARVIREFPSLCADSLPHDGPEARQLDDSPFRVKLCLKEGVEPQGRLPYRIPEKLSTRNGENNCQTFGVQTHRAFYQSLF